MSLFLRSSYRTAQENPGCEPCQKDWTQQSCLDVGGERPEIWSPTWLCHLLATWPKTTYLSLLPLCPCHKARVSDPSILGRKYQQDCWRQPAASRHLRPSTGNSPPNSAGARDKLRGLTTAPAFHSFTAGGEGCTTERASYLLASLWQSFMDTFLLKNMALSWKMVKGRGNRKRNQLSLKGGTLSVLGFQQTCHWSLITRLS